MKLYGTLQSERASKGQGGNKYLRTNITANEKLIISSAIQQTAPDMFSVIVEADGKQIYFNVFSLPTKGEKRKGEHRHHWTPKEGDNGANIFYRRGIIQ